MLENEALSRRNRKAGAKVSRRDAVKLGLAAALTATGRDSFAGLAPVAADHDTDKTSKSMNSKPHVAVVGAGAFGGWTALYLLRGGARVTLLDAWGPGNSRASSGGETRVMRGAYGPNQPYTKMAARAMELWKDHEARWTQKFSSDRRGEERKA
jgi:NADPH-dependent 2,4-dienoyl-CoA reductase/sulfur reductase-like enzyme